MFIDFRKDKVKENTLYGYKNKLPYLNHYIKLNLKTLTTLLLKDSMMK